MSLTLIKAQLKTNLATISGIKTVHAEPPNKADFSPDCPVVIVDLQKPFLTATPEAAQVLRYTWHFNIKFLYKPDGLDTIPQWYVDIEPYPKRFMDVLWGDQKLSGKSNLMGSQNDIEIREDVEYLGSLYFGFELKHDVIEKVATTFA